MIGCYLQGGLGNMMFQIAAIEDMGRRSGIETCYPDLDVRLALLINSASHSQQVFDYLHIFPNFNWHKNYDKAHYFKHQFMIPHKYVLIEPQDFSLYMGYFQSERYFDREATLKLFEPSENIKEILKKYDFTESCSIHVRRGDYTKKYAGTYAILGMDYYDEAAFRIQAKKYYVFSDDMDWCRENFKHGDFIFVNESPATEIFMMSRCTNNIIANSSFSWWGSYLNQNPDKKIIAPSQWYTTYKYSAMDIYCNNWTII
jgi:hypothetical protein